MELPAGSTRPWRWAAAGLVLVLVLAPFLSGWHYLGQRLVFNVLASDSMYYLKIADNFARLGFPSFDGETATNGFHPLWGFLLAAVFRAFRVVHDDQILVVFVLGVALTAAAYLLVARVLLRSLPGLPGLVATALLFPGAYSVLLEPRARWTVEPGVMYGLTPWSAANGVETPLSLVLWACFFEIVTRRIARPQDAGRMPHDLLRIVTPVARICLAAIVLARLDDCLLAAALALVVFAAGGGRPRERLGVIAKILLPTLLAVAAYLVWNLSTVGVLFPVSGVTKISLYAAVTNLRSLLMVATAAPEVQWWHFAARLLPLVAAVLGGTALLCHGRSRIRSVPDPTMPARGPGLLCAALGLAFVLKASFHFLFVTTWAQGYWYGAVAVAAMNVAVAFAAGDAIRRLPSSARWAAPAALALILFRVPNETRFLVSTDLGSPAAGINYADAAAALWSSRREIRADLLRREPSAKLVDTSDGMFAYLLDLPGECATGLASSPEELERRRKIGFWPSVVSRGFTLVPDYGYADPSGSPDVVRVTEVFRPAGSPVDFYRVELVPR